MLSTNNPKIAILGIGTDFRSDDAIGANLVKNLLNDIYREFKLKSLHIIDYNPDEIFCASNILLINSNVSPEFYIDSIVTFHPNIIIIIDSVRYSNLTPGQIILSRIESLPKTNSRISFSHIFPMDLFQEIISLSIPEIPIYLIGIQTENVEYGSEMSNSVMQTDQMLYNFFKIMHLNTFF
jgi:hydrogenase maturation protease